MTVDRDADLDSLRTSCLSFISTGSAESAETLVPDTDDPPPYSSVDQSQPWTSHHYSDTPSVNSFPPTSPSLNSLHPTDSSASNDGKRKLLLIYIHGFMGNETSFQNFPADVHDLLAAILSQTHSVHTKIYPRYRSKKAITVATHGFSEWLAPHESSTTDVILLGHSLGGILAAEVALLPPEDPSSPKSLRHNILGTLSFDTPFLGMHPGVIKSGLGSIFSPSPAPISQQREPFSSNNLAGLEPLGAIAGVANILFNSSKPDPNYNPPFPNDVRLPVRSGWANAVHFVQKHSKDLRHATKQLVTSHLEFGGCLADMDGLKARYTKTRLLEEEAEAIRKTVVHGKPPRVRFANYYTASTGRIKPVKIKSPRASTSDLGDIDNLVVKTEDDDLVIKAEDVDLEVASVISDDEVEQQEIMPRVSEDNRLSKDGMRDVEPIAEIDSDEEGGLDIATPDSSLSHSTSSTSTLASISLTRLDIPGLPNRPTAPSLPANDRAACVRMLLDYSRDLANYRQALKTYRKNHCHLIKEDRKTNKTVSKPCPISMLDAKILGQGKSRADLNNVGTNATRRDSDSISQISTLDPEMERQQQLQLDLESQEHNIDMCEQKIRRLLEKVEKKSEKALLKNVRKIEDVERKITKGIDKAERKAEKDREKAEKKVAKETGKSERKLAKELEKSERKASRDAEKRTKKVGSCSVSDSVSDLASTISTTSSKTLPVGDQTPSVSSSSSKKPKKDKKFCLLPPKDSQGNRDPCWVRVYMQGVDEVGAHCGLFFPWQPGEMSDGQDGSHGSSERYAGLVSGVAERVEEWIGESATARALGEELGVDG